MYVGAGDIHFNEVYALAIIGLGAAFPVFFHREAADVGYDGAAVNLAERRYFLADQYVDTGILQAHGIDHAAGAVCYAGGGVAKTGLPGGSLQGNAAQDVEVHIPGQFQAKAEGAAGGDDGVFQAQAAQHYRKVLYHTISSFLNTGPSLHTRRGPRVVLMVQP